MAHKLSYRSTPCVFLSYVPSHKGYLCLDYTSNRFFICRHVKFHETKFPFRTNSPPHSSLPIPTPALIQMLPSPQLSPTPLPNSPSAASTPSIIQVPFISPDPQPSPSPPPQNTRLMITREKSGISNKKVYAAASISAPRTYNQAAKIKVQTGCMP